MDMQVVNLVLFVVACGFGFGLGWVGLNEDFWHSRVLKCSKRI